MTDKEQINDSLKNQDKNFNKNSTQEKEQIIKNINSGAKCDENCIGHKLYTHNICITCPALKDSPYKKDYLKDKTDEEIVDDIMQLNEELGDDE